MLVEQDAEFRIQAEKFFGQYLNYLNKNGKDLNYAVDCYLKMLADIAYEHIKFIEKGKYSSSSFEEVHQRVYNNPEVMEYYMHGLLLSQFLWEQHYQILKFFTKGIMQRQQRIDRYLEIGAGHGLYISEAIKLLGKDTSFDLVDISETSLNMSKEFIVEKDRVNFYKEDIYLYNKPGYYDFITMGEVLEHVEKPLELLIKINSLLCNSGEAFITTPTNAPAIDHITLFNNVQEIRDLLIRANLVITEEVVLPSEKVTEEIANELKITILYGAFVKKI
ncbi:MAG: class I SAM-dependent methyltransferase [Ignavibacteria bacterium]